MEFSIIDRQVLPGLYSPIEKQSMYQVLCAVRQLGGHDMATKENVIHEAMAITGITSHDQVASRTLNQQQMTAALRNMEDFKKMYLAKFISNVALAGGITPKEEKVVYMFFDMFQIPNID